MYNEVCEVQGCCEPRLYTKRVCSECLDDWEKWRSHPEKGNEGMMPLTSWLHWKEARSFNVLFSRGLKNEQMMIWPRSW